MWGQKCDQSWFVEGLEELGEPGWAGWIPRRELFGFWHPRAGFGLLNPAGTSLHPEDPPCLPSPVPVVILRFQPKPPCNSVISPPPSAAPKNRALFFHQPATNPGPIPVRGLLPLLRAAGPELLPNFEGQSVVPEFRGAERLPFPNFRGQMAFSWLTASLAGAATVPCPPLRDPGWRGIQGIQTPQDPGGSPPIPAVHPYICRLSPKPLFGGKFCLLLLSPHPPPPLHPGGSPRNGWNHFPPYKPSLGSFFFEGGGGSSPALHPPPAQEIPFVTPQ